MAAKKKSTKKTSTKKTSTKKTAKKKRSGTVNRHQAGKRTVVTFMNSLILAGYLGKDLPASSGTKGKDNYVSESSAQKKAAQRLRQMAEKLERQASRFGDEDVGIGGEE